MAQIDIYNPTTNQLGYQIPGATIPKGWTATPPQPLPQATPTTPITPDAKTVYKSNTPYPSSVTGITDNKINTNSSPNDQMISNAEGNLNDIRTQQDDAYKTFKTTADAYANGAIPLTASQTAQIEGLKQQYGQLIDNQKAVNTGAQGVANIRGFQTGAAEYDPSFQNKVIGNIFSAGQAKVAELNTKMTSAVAQLTSAFETDNYKAVKDAYDSYTAYAKEQKDTFQKTIDDAQKRIADANKAEADRQKNERDFNEKIREFDLNQKGDLAKLGLEQAKLAHQLEVDSGSGIGNLNSQGLDMLARGYLTSGTLPSLGYGKSAVVLRTAVVNRAVALSGGNENVNPAVNKSMYDANRATYTQQTKNYVVADTAYRVFDKNGQLALQIAQGLNKSNSPIINQLSNTVINQTTGVGQLDSFKAVITSLQAEYATLINVKGGGNGTVTEGDKTKAETAIPNNISPARLNDVLTNLKKEGQNVLTERQQTLDTLQKNITTSSTAFNNQVSDNPLVGQIITAQSQGHSATDIINTISSNPQYSNAINTARNGGYSDDEIIQFLSTQ